VVGIDLAGPESHTLELGAEVHGYRDLFARARAAALGTTVHTGETTHTAAPGVLAVLKELKPARIGHGIAAAASEEAIRKLAESGTVLEICPSSNLRTRAVANLADLASALRKFENAGVRYTINTDGPYLLNTHLRLEYQMLLDNKVLSEAEAERSVAVARAATFVR
jgi:adenosine deaminase